MGHVYRARDTRLGRLVAIKVSREQFSGRFEREARAVAALNHPNVCQLYDIGPNYLVMELVDGAPVAPVDDVDRLLDFAIQIADGLAAAHAQGIVHRDLKPANVLVARDGRVKILDFGLASVALRDPDSEDLTEAQLTQAGTVMGTAAYMSPEQARGLVVDARTDLWSFGVVLYELATGVRPFEVRAPTVMQGILGAEPRPVKGRAPHVPLPLARIIERLLEKDRELRYQSAADVRADLRRVGRDSGAESVGAERTGQMRRDARSRARLVAAAVIIVLLILAGAMLYLSSPRSAVISPADYEQLTQFTDSVTAPAISPDGRMVAFISGNSYFLSPGQVYVKLLPNGEALQLTDDPRPKLGPVFTPDGSRVAYTLEDRSRAVTSWDTWTVPVHGGEPTLLLPNASGLVWLDQRRVLYSEMRLPDIHMGIVTSTEGRSERREIYFPAHERAMAHYAWASPDRQWILVVEMDRTTAWQRCRLVPFDGRSAGEPVGPDGACIAAAWSPDGAWMYFNAVVAGVSHIWRQRFPDGAVEQLTFGPTEEEGLAMAADGRSLVTAVGMAHSSIWIHESGNDRPLSTEGHAYDPRLSRDGRRLYYRMRQATGTGAELWSRDLATGRAAPLLPGIDVAGYDISPDETEVAYTTRSPGDEPQIWIAPTDRRSGPRLLASGGDQVSFGAGELIFRALGAQSNTIERIGRDGAGRESIGDYRVLEKIGVSPDGEWIVAMVSADAFDTVAIPRRGGALIRICSAGCLPRWSPDGTYFYLPASDAGGAGAPHAPGRTLAIPLRAEKSLPELPAGGILPDTAWTGPPGTIVIDRAGVAPGPDPSTYAFVQQTVQRNLYRIRLP